MNEACDLRKMMYFRHPLTESPSVQDACQSADHDGPG